MISIGLNLILGMLLFCALVMGMRLEKRLRNLRESHTDFAKAVGELDHAAGRTESSLAALRSGSAEIKDELVSRIDQARIACQRLEKLSADAERLANQPLALSRPIERMIPPPLAQAPVGASAIARPEPEPMRAAAPVQTRPAPMAAPEPSPVRSRARMIDDDLFATGAPPPPRRPQPDLAEPRYAEPLYAEREPEPVYAPPPVRAAAEPMMIRADNDPLVGAPRNDRAAREAFYRDVLDRETFVPDPFASGEFGRERRAMMAAVMGGRR